MFVSFLVYSDIYQHSNPFCLDGQSMYQREALWMNFSSKYNRYALKVSVGDVNALTGNPRSEVRHDDKQDYVVVSCAGGQPYVNLTLVYRM